MSKTLDFLSFLNPSQVGFLLENIEKMPKDQLAPAVSEMLKSIPLEQDDRAPVWATRQPIGQKKTSFGTHLDPTLIQAYLLIQAYKQEGHLMADLDPLGLTAKKLPKSLDPKTYGLKEEDCLNGLEAYGYKAASVKELLELLQKTYRQKIALEFDYLQDYDQKKWLKERFEAINTHYSFSQKDIQTLFFKLFQAEGFEKYLHVKFPGAKRFGLDGTESLIPALEFILEKCAKSSKKRVVLGMAHRGRLNVLVNLLNKPMAYFFSKFQNDFLANEYGMGDVKYHLGHETTRTFDGSDLDVSLVYNPSHLEAVNPVALGKVRAYQDLDDSKSKVLGVLIHGDAAFAGQGVVFESLQLAEVPSYQTGGTFHVVINNQVGFTTNPSYSRSSTYCSDVAKIIQAPILHVNADHPHEVLKAFLLAFDFYETFSKDVVIDLVGYRRFGHNEGDEPAFTQPLMYQAISKHPSIAKLYEQKLLQENLLSKEEIDSLKKSVDDALHLAFEDSKTPESLKKAHWLEKRWSHVKILSSKECELEKPQTGVETQKLIEIGQKLSTLPQGFAVNSKILRQYEQKRTFFMEKDDKSSFVDWAWAEALAFGSLALEGHPVRLSGQDCGRGTFSHRHAVLHDQENQKRYIPLNNLSSTQKMCEIIDSPLSENAVLGFEYGYAQTMPDALTLWEGQFGDFSNGAQIIIDQFIASGEIKWLRLNNLVMLLPHSHEGQGPEHTSARLERYLQLCAQDNMRVVNCTTPANYFHVLRRQVKSATRKPLIVMSPKSLLRHKQVVSSLKEMSSSAFFEPVLDDTTVKAQDVKRVILCSGKVYYDLLQEREKANATHIALIRLEQYYPFPQTKLCEVLSPYKKAEIAWCQEEPVNMGAWTFLDRRLESVLLTIKASQTRPIYIGRPEAASPSTGYASVHAKEQMQLVQEAIYAKF